MKRNFFAGLLVLLAIGCALLFSHCADKAGNPAGAPPETHSPAYGTWQDTAGHTYNFSDTTWWSGLNQGTYGGESQGTLYLLGQPFATYNISGGSLTLLILRDSTSFVLTHSSSTPPINPGISSLTRRGNFIALASDRPDTNGTADPLGNIFIYSVDSNAYLDTVYYYDTTITPRTVTTYDTTHVDSVTIKIDTVRTTVYDTTLVEHFVEPIRALTSRPGIDDMPAWSPDGNKLAFVSDRGGYRAIWVYFLDGFANPIPIDDEGPDSGSTVRQNPIQLTDAKSEKGDANPTWSPDGKSIAFERQDTAGGRDVFIIASNDYGEVLGSKNLTRTTADCFNPEWSPKTSVGIILFEEKTSPSSSDWDIFWMYGSDTVGFDSVSHTNKVTNPNRNGHPTWSPDCKMVAYERNPPGNDSAYDIQIQPFNTDSALVTTPTLLTSQSTLQGLNRYPTWLPNGNLIAFVRDNNLMLIDLSGGVNNPSFRKLLDDAYHYWDIAW